MAILAHVSGTASPTVGTELFLTATTAINVPGTYTLTIDLINLAAGDYLEVRIYQMVLTGGTARVAYFASYSHAQPTDNMIAISVPISNELTDTNAIRMSIKQTSGTARTYPYKILRFI